MEFDKEFDKFHTQSLVIGQKLSEGEELSREDIEKIVELSNATLLMIIPSLSFFESISGITTTGSTIITNLDIFLFVGGTELTKLLV